MNHHWAFSRSCVDWLYGLQTQVDHEDWKAPITIGDALLTVLALTLDLPAYKSSPS